MTEKWGAMYIENNSGPRDGFLWYIVVYNGCSGQYVIPGTVLGPICCYYLKLIQSPSDTDVK